VHIWDGITTVEEVMRGLDDIVRQGKVLYVGISDAPAWWIAQANTLAELRGWTPFAGLQIEYSLIERTVERELIPVAKALNLGVLAWSPLASGVLSGKYHGEGTADGGRMSNEEMKQFLPDEQLPEKVRVRELVHNGHSGLPDPRRNRSFRLIHSESVQCSERLIRNPVSGGGQRGSLGL
jgi:aryl-alcohol dehydrogenase-like predicted oxidoreductase